MYYDKRIRYLSYFESDIKLQNAGYVKFQVRDSLCHTIINVKGPRLMGSGEARVYLLSEKQGEKTEDSYYAGGRKNNLEKHIVGTLSIYNGQGHCAVRLNAENMAGSGMRYDEICGVKIELHEYQYLESQWNVVKFMPPKQKPAVNETAGYKLRQEQRKEGGEESRHNREQEEEKKIWQRKWEEQPEEKPVEVNLIVTPVSENLRVEKVVKDEPAAEIEVAEQAVIKTEEFSEKEYRGRTSENTVETAKDDIKQFEEGSTEETSAEIPDDEDSMQKALEREILKEKTEFSTPIERMDRTEAAREEILTGMEEAETAEIETEIQRPEQELQSDKWEQLKMTYPIVHPIREDEEYLKIAPKDFVIFTEKYQELVHNSFLLHGYYNYKHLILGKKEKDGKVIYYLGVPGTFHDREKTVAVMFGFEAFDGKREPAGNGDFGYYLRRVEI